MKRLFIILAAVSLLSGCSKEAPDAAKESVEGDHQETVVHLKGESQKLIALQIVEAEEKPLYSTIEVSGEIASETEDVAHITSPASGTLKSLKVEVGAVVEKGTVLCVIQSRDGKDIEIPSPSHGIVLAWYMKAGEEVDPVNSLLTVANPDLLRASFSVYEKDIAGLQLGQQVLVKSLAYPETDFEGKIAFISPQVDPHSRTVKIRADVKNEEHLIKFGMFVTGKILVPIAEKALVIPVESVQEINGQTVIFVPTTDDPDKFKIVPIKVGRKTDTTLEVLEGIKSGEKLAGRGSYYIKAELQKGELEEE